MSISPIISGCGCYQLGSLSSDCDQVTGNCVCKEHVSGDLCDKCEVRFRFMFLCFLTRRPSEMLSISMLSYMIIENATMPYEWKMND